MGIGEAQIMDGRKVFDFFEKREINRGLSEKDFLTAYKKHLKEKNTCGLLADGSGIIEGVLFGHFRESFCYGGTALVVDVLVGEEWTKKSLVDSVEDFFEGKCRSIEIATHLQEIETP